MLAYNHKHKFNARYLRAHQTDAEQLLWFHLRRKQLRGVQFYRQKVIGHYIVDFYAPKAKLVIEIDGSQHHEDAYLKKDNYRDKYLNSLGLNVLRFDNLQVLKSHRAVLEMIYRALS